VSAEGTGSDLSALNAGVRRWLSSGALQSPGGAFCAWKDAVTSELAFEYPEITGYALTHLASDALPGSAAQDAGERAGRWLRERLRDGELAARTAWDGQVAYNFDLAMIAHGLLAFGRTTGDRELVEAGHDLVADLCDQHRTEGVLPSIRQSARRSSIRSAWSTEGFAHLVKTVGCMLQGGGEEARSVAGDIAGRAALIQGDDGRFTTHPDDHETMLHPHLYAVEGLWMFARATGDADAEERARRGLRWVWEQQLDTGGFPRFVSTASAGHDEVAPEQFDASAQAVRMAALLGERPEGFEAALERLAHVARPDGEAGLALPYQTGSSHLNAWVSMFACQALEAAVAPAPLPWELLV